MVSQIFLAFFSLSALWLAYRSDPRIRRFGPIFGLCGQPFWLYETWGKPGMVLLVFAYTAVHTHGLYKQWKPVFVR